MGIKKIPDKDTPEAQEIIRRVRNGEVETLWRELGYVNKDSFLSALRKSYGFYVSKEPLPEVQASMGLSSLEQEVLTIVQKGAISVGEISRQIDRSSETVIKAIDDLREKGYEVNLDEISRQVSIPQEPSKEFKPTEFKYFKKFYRIGLVSDTHFCSRYQQVTLLHDAYAEFDKQQVDFVLHAGDLVDGRGVYRGQDVEVFKSGADEQADYVIQNYPHLERGRKTYIIGGSHDRAFFRDGGFNIIRAICKERKDLVDRGFDKAEFIVKGLKVGLMHPAGGVAYARSYKMQKIIENMAGYIMSIPSATAPILVVFGHWHVPCHLESYMGIEAMSMPCFQSQTPYLERLGLMPVVGYRIVELWLDKDGSLSKITPHLYNQNSQIKKADYL